MIRSALNQKNSPLLRLPAELRNRVYEYVFDDLCLNILPSRKIALVLNNHVEYATIGLAITTVSRQLHIESRLLPFLLGQVMAFSSHGFMSGIKMLSPEQRDAIQNIRLWIDEYSIVDLLGPRVAASGNTYPLPIPPALSLQELIRPVLHELPGVKNVEFLDYCYSKSLVLELRRNSTIETPGVNIVLFSR